MRPSHADACAHMQPQAGLQQHACNGAAGGWGEGREAPQSDTETRHRSAQVIRAFARITGASCTMRRRHAGRPQIANQLQNASLPRSEERGGITGAPQPMQAACSAVQHVQVQVHCKCCCSKLCCRVRLSSRFPQWMNFLRHLDKAIMVSSQAQQCRRCRCSVQAVHATSCRASQQS